MANRILTIELGSAITKICEMDYKVKKPIVYHCFHVPTPAGVLDDGVVEMSPELVETIQAALTAKNIRTKKVVFTIASNKIANREVEVPVVKDNQLRGLVVSNAKDYFPVELSQYDLCFKKGIVIDDGAVKKQKLQVYATPQFLTQSYRELAAACGLQLVALDFVGNSISSVFTGEFTEGVHLIVKIEDSSCLLTVFNNDQITFQRSVPNGVDSAITMLQNAPGFGGNLSFTEALRLFRTMPIIQPRFLTQEEKQDFQNGKTPVGMHAGDPVITGALRDFVNGISRTVDYYNAQNGQSPIQDLFLTGTGAEFIGIRELLTSELGRNAITLQRYQNIRLDNRIANTSIGAYVSCIGAGFEPLQYEISGRKQKRDEVPSNSKVNFMRLGVITCGLGAVGAVSLSLFGYQNYVREVKDYNKTVDAYSQVIDTKKLLAEYDAVTAAYQDFMQVKTYTNSQNMDFVKIITEMENQMPSNCVLTAITSTTEELSLNVETDSMIAMGSYLSVLRNMEWFQSVMTDGFSSNMEIDAETGEIKDVTYTFSVTCKYIPYDTTRIRSEALGDPTISSQIKFESDKEGEDVSAVVKQKETDEGETDER